MILLYTFRLEKMKGLEHQVLVGGRDTGIARRWEWRRARWLIERAIWQIFGMFSVHTQLPTQQFSSWAFVLKMPSWVIGDMYKDPHYLWRQRVEVTWVSVTGRVDGYRVGVPHGVSNESPVLDVHTGTRRHLRKQSAEWKRKRNRKDM